MTLQENLRERNIIMDKVYNIDEIFGSENVKVQAILTEHLKCSGCFFNKAKFPYCFRPAYVDFCVENGINLIFIEYDKKRRNMGCYK